VKQDLVPDAEFSCQRDGSVHEVTDPAMTNLTFSMTSRTFLAARKEVLRAFLHRNPAQEQDDLLIPADPGTRERPPTIALDTIVHDSILWPGIP